MTCRLPWGAPKGMFGTFVAMPTLNWKGLEVKCRETRFHVYPPGSFVVHWLAVGPYPNPENKGLDTWYLPEGKTDVESDASKLQWRLVDASEEGIIDLREFFKPEKPSVAYALTHVYSPDNRKAKILFGSDDGAKVWVNDRPVFVFKKPRGLVVDEDAFDVNLKKGWNKVMVKVADVGIAWAFSLRFLDPSNKLRFDTKTSI